ncbi:MAG: (d)CMP kinase [Alphaproteobacteria bacterium]
MIEKPIIAPIIAIDGPAASGKGTLARKIAETLSYAHLDTGMLYRAVAYMVLETGSPASDTLAAITAANSLTKAGNIPFAENILKDERVTEAASHVSSIPEVRNLLLNMQKSFAAAPGSGFKGAVLDGRDIGTVICPDAPVKLFITASPETRADRRFKELQSRGLSTTYEAVLRDMRARDSRDAARTAAPMRVADDAITLDTTNLNQREALEKALEIIRKKLPA